MATPRHATLTRWARPQGAGPQRFDPAIVCAAVFLIVVSVGDSSAGRVQRTAGLSELPDSCRLRGKNKRLAAVRLRLPRSAALRLRGLRRAASSFRRPGPGTPSGRRRLGRLSTGRPSKKPTTKPTTATTPTLPPRPPAPKPPQPPHSSPDRQFTAQTNPKLPAASTPKPPATPSTPRPPSHHDNTPVPGPLLFETAPAPAPSSTL
jgi:hypothetical protein